MGSPAAGLAAGLAAKLAAGLAAALAANLFAPGLAASRVGLAADLTGGSDPCGKVSVTREIQFPVAKTICPSLYTTRTFYPHNLSV